MDEGKWLEEMERERVRRERQKREREELVELVAVSFYLLLPLFISALFGSGDPHTPHWR